MNIPAKDADRRRIYLMRHGSVTYFDEATGAIANAEQVQLNANGRAQADAAGKVFASAGVRFDRVIVSGLPRTVETAQRVLAQTGQKIELQIEPDLQEIRGGKLSGIPADQLRDAFLGAIDGMPDLSARFLGGESLGELFDRVLPRIKALRDDPDWDVILLVLHGGVNRAILSWLLTGQRLFIGGLAQAPACINALDIGPSPLDVVLRMANFSPLDPAQTRTRTTTMEQLYGQFLKVRDLLARTRPSEFNS
jgi:probable phosphoglycerate mutase